MPNESPPPQPEPGAHPVHEANRLSWNAATRAHNSHKPKQAEFLREGGSTLFSEEAELLGDLSGQRVLHLLCNSGQDSLSMARGAGQVTGVDISDEAIETARRLSAESGIPATFYRADVYAWLADAMAQPERFDTVYFSYGALCWLSDLEGFFGSAARLLNPGGRIVGVEFHPTGMMFDENWELSYPYSTGGEPFVEEDGIRDYVASSGEALAAGEYAAGEQAFKNPHPNYEFAWGMGEILTGLIDAGLILTHFREYPYSNGCAIWSEMELGEDRRWRMPQDTPGIPLMFSVVAMKPR